MLYEKKITKNKINNLLRFFEWGHHIGYQVYEHYSRRLDLKNEKKSNFKNLR